MACQQTEDFMDLACQVQVAQQDLIYVSDYHIHAASRLFKMDFDDAKKAMGKLGCNFWPDVKQRHFPSNVPKLPNDESDLCSIVFQFSHQLAPLFYLERRKWSLWLNHVNANTKSSAKPNQYTQAIYESLLNYFDAADQLVDDALKQLREHGFNHPKQIHLFQASTKLNDKVPLLLLHAAVVMKENDLGQDYTDATPLFDSLESHHLHDSQENLGFWGFADSGFVVKADKQGQRFVSMKGTRYGLCGRPLRKLLPFIESEMQIQINPLKEFGSVSPVWRRMHESRFNDSEKKFLCETFTHSSFSTLDRVRHGTGHSQEDVYLIRTGGLVRIPDAVIWPQCEEDVEKLVDMAKSLGWCLIPFGGGTNVTNATRCPTEDVETRPIISVDMKRMRKILWVNEEDGLAYVEAGITGRELVEELARDGLTMGHEPDSIEFSTLGGWIATKASGMKRSRYGNIEDIVKSVHVIGPNGLQWQGSEDGEITPGRAAEGLDLCSLVMGSEGCLGIITSAVIRIWPLPEVREYESVILQSFQEGLQFTRAVARLGANKPASVRLLDNAHFRLGQALRPKESTILGQLKKSLFLFTTFILGTHDPMSVVCATISYEGSSAEVKAQKKAMGDIAAAHGGMMLGSNIGKAGYDLTFMIAYLRDFAMTYHLLGESFETFVPWSKVETLIGATKARISQEHAIRLLPGLPFVGCRVTQLYHEGVCLYFYLCFSFDGVDNASEVFAELEKAARDEILDRGGSLSHHHGIGKLRAPLLKDRASPSYSDTIATIKKALDNDNIFGARNGTYSK
jgi:alkyldihydroxyacetonephosphate synthase